MEPQCSIVTNALACTICGKPFTSTPAYKRHVNYCSQAQKRPRKRMRSCLACSAAKHKCSFGHPCTRCAARAIACHYQQRGLPVSGATTPPPTGSDLISPITIQHSHGPGAQRLQSTVLEPDLAWRKAEILPADEVTAMARLAFQEISYDELKTFYDALMKNENVSSTAFIMMGTLLPGMSSAASCTIRGFSPNSTSASLKVEDLVLPGRIMPHCTPQLSIDDGNLLKRRAALHSLTRNQIPGNGYRLPPTLQPRHNVRPLDLVRHDAIFYSSSRGIVECLRSYPFMMTRRKSFPPIIHQYCDSVATLPEALSQCAEIARLFIQSPQGERQEVWAKISAQQAIFRANIDISSKMDIVSQIQADLIYVLMRALDDQSPSLVIGLEDLEVHQLLAIKSINLIEFESILLLMNPWRDTSWAEWVYDETRRRLACLWFIISRVVDIRHGVWCPGLQGCRDMPLPAPKALWEARSEAEWREERREIEARSGSMLTTIGDLLDAREAGTAGQRALSMWYAECDSFGHLLRLAVSLI
ncbi:uncharacterized protein B0I36DRAFT_379824 [Microdochium trichocladiopsis]|uniref:Zn(2)-C6 fungal-type domain-containing protein n=1 Tax=Microdochium trichocladiopsis TaxID=1682393 RepID=A0A9P9BWN6_9PEZI|nr:uncharacterized protein B0I36DRAFT_379824 [Microdochium trichocladiopsis]KAH7040977.1 hypothetical protein B0I36DRAFT_379824 [Microdochium trichocladiopsis]